MSRRPQNRPQPELRVSKEVRRRMSLSHTGLKHTQETIEKIITARLLYWRERKVKTS
jgi:hypothetical protein